MPGVFKNSYQTAPKKWDAVRNVCRGQSWIIDECWPSLLSGAKLFCSQLPDCTDRFNRIAAAVQDNGLFQALSSLFHSGYSGAVLKSTVSFYRGGRVYRPMFPYPTRQDLTLPDVSHLMNNPQIVG